MKITKERLSIIVKEELKKILDDEKELNELVASPGRGRTAESEDEQQKQQESFRDNLTSELRQLQNSMNTIFDSMQSDIDANPEYLQFVSTFPAFSGVWNNIGTFMASLPEMITAVERGELPPPQGPTEG